MLRRRPRAVAIRLALAVAWAALPAQLGAAPALAIGADAGTSELSSWLSDTAARALQAAEPDNDLAAGAREGLNRSVSRAFSGLQQIGPAWLRRVEVDLRFQEDLEIAYDVAVTQPLLRSWQGRDRLWLRGQLRHEPAGRSLSDLGLFYRHRLLGRDFTLGVNGAVEEGRLLDYERFALGTTVRSRRLRVPRLAVRRRSGPGPRRTRSAGPPARRLRPRRRRQLAQTALGEGRSAKPLAGGGQQRPGVGKQRSEPQAETAAAAGGRGRHQQRRRGPVLVRETALQDPARRQRIGGACGDFVRQRPDQPSSRPTMIPMAKNSQCSGERVRR